MNLSVWLENLVFAWPWLALTLPLPLLAWLLPPVTRDATGGALRVPAGGGFAALIETKPVGSAWLTPRTLFGLLAWCLIVAAATRPQLLADAQSAPLTGRNLMLAVDLSGSMEAKDFQLAGRAVDRLTATKAVGGDFIDRREGDRLGLILFGVRAYLQTPLTFDRQTIKTLLLESAIGLAGEKTAIGDAIALAVKRLREADADGEEQVLVLLTDGANTAGSIEPLKAAELAATIGLKIYTIGIGAERMQIQSGMIPRLVNPSSDLDEETLTRIAEITGGRYFRARDTAGLAGIYRELDALEPAADEESGLRPRDEVFHLPLALGLLLLGALALPRMVMTVTAR
ncbi:MAG: VWA domain-containing protein [Pseudomonadota bacterium]